MEDWWQEQIQNLNKKVEIFEKKEDKKRFEKRNNIVIIGLSLEEKKEEEIVEDLIKAKLGINTIPRQYKSLERRET